ncbi:glycosyltransferase [Novipirellula caenicola]|uniref:Glycosyl transferases group 1 n=1 Tax=Novipirellula caenicola TaxID=1536901 RepID=A0ABP9W145_9BACT
MSTRDRLLIVEEALRDQEGHWFEYNRATKAAVGKVGKTKVEMLGNITMVDSVAHELGAKPHFRFTVWDQIYNHPQAWKRYLGILQHNRRLYQDLSSHFANAEYCDTVFAPTVVLHHFLGYYKFTKKFGGKKFRQLVLLVRNNIAIYDSDGNRTFRSTAKFWKWAIQRFQPMINSGLVRFVTDSERLADEYEELTGIRFQALPHPSLIGIYAPSDGAKVSGDVAQPKGVRLFLPGPARYEKGADRLVEAAKLLDKRDDLPPIEIVLQWSSAFSLPDGSELGPSDLSKLGLEKVTFDIIEKPLDSDSYHKQLLRADLIVLPYRREAYFARISGVAVEAMMLGKPILYTSNTWVGTIAERFGCGIAMENNTMGVRDAIVLAAGQLHAICSDSQSAKLKVSEFFSANSFASILIGNRQQTT